MKVSKRLLIGLIGLSLSVSATAIEFKDNVLTSAFVEPAKVLQLSSDPVDQPSQTFTLFVARVGVASVLIHDYGAGIDLQVNSNELNYRESNVLFVNFAKEQNQNFERMRLAS